MRFRCSHEDWRTPASLAIPCRGHGGGGVSSFRLRVWLDGTSASCVPPRLRVDPGNVRLGEAVQLHGTFFTDTCADTSYPPPVHSLRGLSITIEQAGRSQPLRRVDAQGTRGTLEVAVRLPLTLKKGPATVRVGSTAAASLQLV